MNWKRILSFFLSICICISLVAPVSALEDTTDISIEPSVTDDAQQLPEEPSADTDSDADPEEPSADIDNDADTEEPSADIGNNTVAEEPTTNADNLEPVTEFLPDMSNWILVGTALIPSKARANNTWSFYISYEYHDTPNSADNYIIYKKKYGINLHRAYNSAEGKVYNCYCLNQELFSYTDPSYKYTIETLPTSAFYQVSKYVAALGYGNNNVARLKQMFGYTVNDVEAAQATQAAIWAAQYAALDEFSLSSAHRDSDALKLAKDMANAALSIWKDGVSLTASTATLVSETPVSTTYRFTVTAKNCYGGYTATVSGLPSGATVTGSTGVTVSGSTFASTTANGTNTITVVIPKATTAQTYAVKLNLSSYNQNYSNNNSVLYANSDTSNEQDFLVAGTGGLTPTTATVNFSIPVPRETMAQISITKRDIDTQELVPNVVFALYEWNGTEYVDTGNTATTNASGVATFTDLRYTDTNIGVFQVYEKSSATHTIFTNRPVCTVSISSGNWWAYASATAQQTTGTATKNSSGSYDFSFSFTVYNEPKTGSITVSKRDADTNATLQGAVFGLYEWNGSAYADTGLTATTNASGIATFSDQAYSAVNEGKYQVKEISAPKDYELDEAFYANVNIVTGAYEYKSSLVSKSGTITSGATVTGTVNGETRDLISGNIGTGFDFTVYAFDTPHWTPTNESLTVSKILSQNGDEITYLSGATFTLQEKVADGTWADCIELVERPNRPGYNRLPTYEDGSLIFTPEFGTVYRVVETAAPDGVLNSGWISDEFSWEPDNVVEFSFTCKDEIPTGAFQLKKTDAETGLPLAGVKFSVTAAKDITYTLNDTVTTVYKEGAKIADLTTDENGTAGLDGLYYGTYTITETATVEDYLFDETVFTAVVGAPSGYNATNTYPVSSAIGVTTYTGIATVIDYEEYHAAEYGKYVKDNSGYVVRYNKTVDGSYTQAADGKYAKVEYASVTNQPLHPDMAVAKLTDRTTDSQGGAVDFDADTGRYTEDKIPGTYYNSQTVTFTLTATNTGDVDLYNLYMVDVMSADIWTVVQQPADVTFRAADGSELVVGSTVTTTLGNTAAITNVIYDDESRTYTIYFDKLLVDDSVSILTTFTLFNYDGINKTALPNDVYLYGQYLTNGTSGNLTDVPGGGEDDYDCHDKDAINVVSVGSISIHKTDDTGKDMAGVVFQLTDADGNAVQFVLQDGVYRATVVADNGDWVSAADSGLSVTTDLVTDSKGTIELEGLSIGTYTLTEIKTTEGHALLGESITVTLPYAVEGDEDTSTGQVYYADGTNYYLHLDLDISNAVTIRLPSTGGVSVDLWLTAIGIAMVGLVVIALTVPVCTRKRQVGRE